MGGDRYHVVEVVRWWGTGLVLPHFPGRWNDHETPFLKGKKNVQPNRVLVCVYFFDVIWSKWFWVKGKIFSHRILFYFFSRGMKNFLYAGPDMLSCFWKKIVKHLLQISSLWCISVPHLAGNLSLVWERLVLKRTWNF